MLPLLQFVQVGGEEFFLFFMNFCRIHPGCFCSTLNVDFCKCDVYRIVGIEARPGLGC